jgi:hypothetical protein
MPGAGTQCFPRQLQLVLLCYKSRFPLVDFPGPQEAMSLTWAHEAPADSFRRSIAAF